MADPAASRPDRARVRRRAVGPPGARPVQDEPRLPVPPSDPDPESDDERLRADRPPHHDRGV